MELSGCKPIICVAPKEIETYSYWLLKRVDGTQAQLPAGVCEFDSLSGMKRYLQYIV